MISLTITGFVSIRTGSIEVELSSQTIRIIINVLYFLAFMGSTEVRGDLGALISRPLGITIGRFNEMTYHVQQGHFGP